MFRLTHQNIIEDTDSGSYTRGLKYFRQGRVSSCSAEVISANVIDIAGVVTGRDIYHQSISVMKDAVMVDISGGCTCPVGYNCKHVVAVLHEYIRQYPVGIGQEFGQSKTASPPTASSAAMDDWLKELTPGHAQVKSAAIKQEKNWLAYFLTQTAIEGEISVAVYKTGNKKKGGYLKPRLLDQGLSFYHIQYGYHQNYNSTDLEIMRLLVALDKSSFQQEFVLKGQTGWLALQKILKTKRSYWQEISDHYLVMGDTVPLAFNWALNDAGSADIHQLVRQAPEHCHLLLTDPPCQIDTKNNRIDLFANDLNHEQLTKLMKPLLIAEKDLMSFTLGMIKNNLDQYLPLPLEVTVEDLHSSIIRPKAIVTRIQDPADAESMIDCLRLSVLYGETEIQLQDDKDVVIHHLDAKLDAQRKDRLIRIKRDLEKEASFLQALTPLKFKLISSYPQIINDQNDKQALVLAVFEEEPNAVNLPNMWHRFLEFDRFDLEDQGWIIEIDDGFQMEFIHPMDDWEVEVEQENDWFSLKFDIALDDSGDNKVPLLPIVSQLLAQHDISTLPSEIMVEHLPGQFLILPKGKILPILQLMLELFDSLPIDSTSIKLSAFDALLVNQLDSHEALNIRWLGDLEIKKLADKLANFEGIKTVMPAKSFKGTLRDYQVLGLGWLQFLREYGFNGILADDMGLGKTLQTLAHLQKEKMAKRLSTPCLIVAPTSLMSNWKKEAGRFTPNLKVHISQGANRGRHFFELSKFDIILTTYPLVLRDFDVLSKLSFHMLILDEAQNIKNPKSKTTKAIKALKANHRLALTGTPMENHLGELWSIFDFLMPGFLSSESVFNAKYRKPIERENDQAASNSLNRRISPFLLRRTKQIVASELPERTEIIKSVSFEAPQSMLYETIRLSMEKKIRQAIASKGLNRSHITILDALLKLRQVCCDPQLVKLSQARKVKQSAKMELLMLMLPELIEEGHKVLIFSQFTSMLSIIEKAIIDHGITYTKLTGSTRKREAVIEQFTSGQVDVFLISLKAGGVGLNLTAADTVIHYDPWWNPAVENQASDRAHRIGQDKPVFIYKLVVENTLEEKILEMQARKQALADGIYGDKNAKDASKLTAEDLEDLLGT